MAVYSMYKEASVLVDAREILVLWCLAMTGIVLWGAQGAEPRGSRCLKMGMKKIRRRRRGLKMMIGGCRNSFGVLHNSVPGDVRVTLRGLLRIHADIRMLF